MTLVLYSHPFSSYTQKALIALYENATPFEFKVLGPATPGNFEALKKLWPIAKLPGSRRRRCRDLRSDHGH